MMYVVCCDTSIGTVVGRSIQTATPINASPTKVPTAATTVRRASFDESASLIALIGRSVARPRLPARSRLARAALRNQESNMRVFVAGATGAIGKRLVPRLLEQGHEVVGTARSADGAAWLRARGAKAVPLDLLEPQAVRGAVRACRADAIIHEGTALAGARSFSNPDRTMAGTNRLRTKGTEALLAAARDAG